MRFTPEQIHSAIRPNTEVLGQVITDKARREMLSMPEVETVLKDLGIYVRQERVDRAAWYKQVKYLHVLER